MAGCGNKLRRGQASYAPSIGDGNQRQRWIGVPGPRSRASIGPLRRRGDASALGKDQQHFAGFQSLQAFFQTAQADAFAIDAEWHRANRSASETARKPNSVSRAR